MIDSTDFAPPGSRLGRSLDEVFAEMLRAAGHNLRMAERGALLLEDLDKLAQGLSPDVSRHLQQAWLRFMDGERHRRSRPRNRAYLVKPVAGDRHRHV